MLVITKTQLLKTQADVKQTDLVLRYLFLSTFSPPVSLYHPLLQLLHLEEKKEKRERLRWVLTWVRDWVKVKGAHWKVLTDSWVLRIAT